tara:strand:+ start:3516 stop:3809 length:294 start_codon:yes stop_codon:yes gene_type:complete
MSRNQILPYFPIPPKEYSVDYMNQIMQSFSLYMNQIQTPGEGRNTNLTFVDLQKHDRGLESGGVFNHGGSIKITETHKPHVEGFSSSGSIGSVSVTT